MGHTVEHVDASNGELFIHTDVAGRAARMGHRLTISMTAWRAAITFDEEAPSSVELTAEVESLQVLRGEGGVTPLSGPEKAVVRSNALGCFNARRYPQIRFFADDVVSIADGYRLTGTLEIHGVTRPQVVDVSQNEDEVTSAVLVRQSDFGIKPYSMFLGSLKVADEVRVTFRIRIASP